MTERGTESGRVVPGGVLREARLRPQRQEGVAEDLRQSTGGSFTHDLPRAGRKALARRGGPCGRPGLLPSLDTVSCTRLGRAVGNGSYFSFSLPPFSFLRFTRVWPRGHEGREGKS